MVISLTKRSNITPLTSETEISEIFANRVPFNFKYDENSTESNL